MGADETKSEEFGKVAKKMVKRPAGAGRRPLTVVWYVDRIDGVRCEICTTTDLGFDLSIFTIVKENIMKQVHLIIF